MIKCSLIEVDNDHRAIICTGAGSKGSVKKTRPLDWIDYQGKQFHAAGRTYDFSK